VSTKQHQTFKTLSPQLQVTASPVCLSATDVHVRSVVIESSGSNTGVLSIADSEANASTLNRHVLYTSGDCITLTGAKFANLDAQIKSQRHLVLWYFGTVVGDRVTVSYIEIPAGGKCMSEETVTTGYIPRPLQAKLHKELKRFSVMVCHRRFGKCHTALTPVLTSNGFKPISEITEGEHVFTPSGKPTKVLKTYERGLKEIYEVVFSNGESIECDDEHQWYAEPAFSAVGERAKRNPWACGKLLTTKELMDSDHKFIRWLNPWSLRATKSR